MCAFVDEELRKKQELEQKSREMAKLKKEEERKKKRQLEEGQCDSSFCLFGNRDVQYFLVFARQI